MKLLLVIVFGYLSVVTEGTMPTNACNNENESVRCCAKCLPGFGSVLPCAEDDGKGCARCTEGETFSPGGNNATCRACSNCSLHAHVAEPCNATHDAACECNRGFHWDSVEQRCQLCDLCPHGYGAARPCGPHSNTECRECALGSHYSGILSGNLGCSPCSVCKENQVMLQECNPIQDTVCVAKDLPRFVNRVSTPLPPGATDDVTESHDFHSEKSIIPVYCAILGMIVVGLLAYVVFKQWNLRAAGKLPKDDAEDEECLHKKTNPVDHSNNAKDTETIKLSSIPSGKRREIETLLNVHRADQCDWRGLAAELGNYH